MEKQFEHTGFWFLPDCDTNKIAGVLTYSPVSGILLKLIGAFKDLELGTIWGEVDNGKQVTLCGAFMTDRSGSFTTYTQSQIRGNSLFIGVWFKDIADLRIYGAMFKCLYANTWNNHSGLNSTMTSVKPVKINVTGENPPIVLLNLTATLSCKLKTVLTKNLNRHPETTISLVEKHYFELISKTGLSFNQTVTNVFHLVNFLTLCIQNESFIQELKINFKLKGQRNIVYSTHVYFNLPSVPEFKPNIHHSNMLLPYRDLENNLEVVMQEWFAILDKVRPSLIPYTANYYSRYDYVSDKFLNMTASMEAYHRDFINPREIHFKDRVKDLLVRSKGIYKRTLKIGDLEALAKEIKDRRNDWTHSNPIIISNKNSTRIHRLTEIIKLVMACTYLQTIGVDKKILKRNVESSNTYKTFKLK